MTLDEKIQLVHGSGIMGYHQAFGDPALLARALGGAGFVPGVARLGIPDIQMADSAVGVASARNPAAIRRPCLPVSPTRPRGT